MSVAVVHLALAIVCEVVATTSLKHSDGFRNPGPSLLVVLGYGAALYLLSLTLRRLPLGVTYAVWSGVGTALLVVVGVVLHRHVPGPLVLAGIALILVGVVLVNLGGDLH